MTAWGATETPDVEVDYIVVKGDNLVWRPVTTAAYPSMDLARGRARRFSEAEAGTATLTLDNSDGTFTANRPDGIVMGKSEIRVRAFSSTLTGNHATEGFDPTLEAWSDGDTLNNAWPGPLCNVDATVSTDFKWAGSNSLEVLYNANDYSVDQHAVLTVGHPRLTESSVTISAYAYIDSVTCAAGVEAFLGVYGMDYSDLPSTAKTTTRGAWTRLYLTVDMSDASVCADGPYWGLRLQLGNAKANQATGNKVYWEGFQVEVGSSATTFTTDAPTGYWNLWRGPVRAVRYLWQGLASNRLAVVSASDRLALLGEANPLPSLLVGSLWWLDGRVAASSTNPNPWSALNQPHTSWTHLTGASGHTDWAEVTSTPHPH